MGARNRQKQVYEGILKWTVVGKSNAPFARGSEVAGTRNVTKQASNGGERSFPWEKAVPDNSSSWDEQNLGVMVVHSTSLIISCVQFTMYP